ncbi:CMRF35-like molecule 8 isoform X2 [Echeneis naucrates]|nr:CMRF35-like molecule 8 isoform X2 [Echeneis naucrates]XP_029358549.1 CMRF35-like molecule 8 isoform X2 [Echeneis naucrates]
MGATWISWRATVAVTVVFLQIRGPICATIRTVTGVEGQTLSFTCEYPPDFKNNGKCLYQDSKDKPLIWTDKHNQWDTTGRFSLYDNTTEAFFIVKLNQVVPEDSGTYWCGVGVEGNQVPSCVGTVQLNVFRAEKTAENLMHYTTVMSSSPKDFIVDKLHMPLFLTAVMCVAALLFVCLFTLGLLWAVKQQGSSQHENRKTSSSDYESVTPMAGTEPEHNCAHLSPAPPPPPDFCPHFTSKYRESIVSLSLGDYVDVDVPGHMTQYQHLDLSQLEEHVYYSLSGNHSPKDEHVAAKQQTSH